MLENRVKPVFLAIGSNLGDKKLNIEKAKFKLSSNNNIKILAKGEFKSKLKFIGFNFSKNAKTIVEKNGGTFENLNKK